MPIVDRSRQHRLAGRPGDQKAERDELRRRLPFGDRADRHRHAQLGQIFAQARHQNFAAKNDDRRPQRPSRDRLVGDEHQQHGGDQQFVGDRIEHAAERGLLRPGAREIAVEKIGDRRRANRSPARSSAPRNRSARTGTRRQAAPPRADHRSACSGGSSADEKSGSKRSPSGLQKTVSVARSQ